MSLSTELTRIRENFVGETSLILTFIRRSEAGLKRREARAKPSDFDEKDWAELKKLRTFTDNVIKRRSTKGDSITLHSEKLGKLVMSKIEPMKHKTMLGEMSLSYLISFQEAFLKDYLRTVLSSRRALLRSSKQLSYEAICEHRSMTSLIGSLAQKEVDALGFGSIDDFAKYFLDKFNIDFGVFPRWKELREATYRRHLILHNRGITNERYCQVTGFKGTNKHLSTDISYCITAGEMLLEFMDFAHGRMMEKLKLSQPHAQKTKRPTSASRLQHARKRSR